MEKVLVLYSGGKDSTLLTLKLLEEEKEVYLVTYENGYELKIDNIHTSIERLKKYNKQKIHYIGVKQICAIWREFLYPYYNLKLSDIVKQYGEVPISQFNCLSCRFSMYIVTILLCQKYGIKHVADGARKSQLFAIEQEELLNEFVRFFKKYDIKMEYPLKDLKDDFQLKNELLIRGFVPKMLEPQCLLGIPLSEKEIDKQIIEATLNVLKELLIPKAEKMMERYKNIEITEDFI